MIDHAAASAFGRCPVSGRSSYALFHGGLPTALLTIPLRDAVWPLTCMLAHKAVPHACRHLLFTYMCSARYQLAQTPVSPHGAAGQQKQTPLTQGGLPTALLTIPLRDAVWPLTFMLAHKAGPHECRHLLFNTMCSTIPPSPALTPVSPHGAAGQQKHPSLRNG